MPDRGDAHLLQVVRGELQDHGAVHGVVAERRLVLAEAEAAQPLP
jgi:hypothetical protein